jgi:hypothetical protein
VRSNIRTVYYSECIFIDIWIYKCLLNCPVNRTEPISVTVVLPLAFGKSASKINSIEDAKKQNYAGKALDDADKVIFD